jgi:putative Holliday junction resolvase
VRVIGIDYGERRIGLAITDPSATLARPWRVLRSTGGTTDAVARVAAAIEALDPGEDPIGLIVVGLPAHLDGTPHEHASRVRAFAEALGAHLARPVVFQDERLTSHEAESRLALRERDWRKRKQKLDAAAAAVILQDYIDEHGGDDEVTSHE